MCTAVIFYSPLCRHGNKPPLFINKHNITENTLKFRLTLHKKYGKISLKYSLQLYGEVRLMRKLIQLKNKKGFTLVELIAVIGIIGILTAIILPVSLNAGKPQAAMSKAKSFYFGSQRILIQYKADSPAKQTGYLSYEKEGNSYTIKTGDYLYICAKADKNKGFTELKLAKLDANDDGSAANPATGYTQYQFAAEITASSTVIEDEYGNTPAQRAEPGLAALQQALGIRPTCAGWRDRTLPVVRMRPRQTGRTMT